MTKMMPARARNQFRAIRIFIESKKANVDYQYSDGGRTLLIAVTYGGFLPTIRYLVEKGNANVDLQDNNGLTALMEASMRGYLEVVRYLVENGNANMDLRDNHGRTALMLASTRGKLDVVRYFWRYSLRAACSAKRLSNRARTAFLTDYYAPTHEGAQRTASHFTTLQKNEI